MIEISTCEDWFCAKHHTFGRKSTQDMERCRDQKCGVGKIFLTMVSKFWKITQALSKRANTMTKHRNTWNDIRSNVMNSYRYHKTKKQSSQQIVAEENKIQKPKGRIYNTTKSIYNGVAYNLKASTWRTRFEKLKYYTFYHFLPFVIIGYAGIRLGAWLLFGDYDANYLKFRHNNDGNIETDTPGKANKSKEEINTLNLQENSAKPP